MLCTFWDSVSGAVSGINLPPNWEPMKHGQLCHEHQLFPGHGEYDRVKSEFQKSGGTGTIVKVLCVNGLKIQSHKGWKIFNLYHFQFILFCHKNVSEHLVLKQHLKKNMIII